ncbi:hypothetical protein BJ165DRAFT_1409636 [Panaeolus papilionaceus]|nr:hypothetical protein BJ165DRAFT_1409636 [Panaeolus papilionaceus]
MYRQRKTRSYCQGAFKFNLAVWLGMLCYLREVCGRPTVVASDAALAETIRRSQVQVLVSLWTKFKNSRASKGISATSSSLKKLRQPTFTATELAWMVQFNRYASVVTILFYDYLIQFSEEYKFVYRSRWTSIKVAYLFCRYFPLISWSIITFSYVLDHDVSNCRGLVIFQHLAYVILHFCPQFVLMIRAWAFSGQTKGVFVLLSLSLVAYLGIELWAYCSDMRVNRLVFQVFERTGCFRRYDFSKRKFGTSSIFLDITAGAVMTFYWWKTAPSPEGNVWQHLLTLKFNLTVATKGVVFFGFMLLSNISSTLLLMNSFKGFDGIPFMTTLLIPNMLACRFILQLRKTAAPNQIEQLHKISKQIGRAFPDAGLVETEIVVDIEDARRSHSQELSPVEGFDTTELPLDADDE